MELGLVYGVEATPPTASVRMTMTSAACPLGDYLTDAVRDALRARFPELEQVDVELVWDPPWTPERMTPEMEKLFKDLSKIEGEPPASRGGRSFWDRMKEALGA